MSPYGITVPLPGPLHDQQALYRELVDLGYTDAWSAEAADNDGLTPLALAAAWAPELRLGTAILPAYTRSPALMAQCAATMASAAPGRFALGIGSSSDVIVERWNGVPFEAPYQRVRDTVRFLRWLHDWQHPADCASRPVAFFAGHEHGTGSQLHVMAHSMLRAVATGRTFVATLPSAVPFVSPRRCPSAQYDCVFEPISGCDRQYQGKGKMARGKAGVSPGPGGDLAVSVSIRPRTLAL